MVWVSSLKHIFCFIGSHQMLPTVILHFDVRMIDWIALQGRLSIEMQVTLLELSLVPTATPIDSPLLITHFRK